MRTDPIGSFDSEEEAKEAFRYMYCKGGLNPAISTFLVACLIAKSQFEKVILICEAKNDKTGIFAKFLLYVQITIGSLVVIVTL